MKSFAALATIVLPLVMLAGCGTPTDQGPAATTPEAQVTLEAIETANWDKLLAGHRGKVVVVDTWATWCLTCMEEFPHLVALDRDYRDQGVQCLSVTIDGPGAHEAARAFLADQGAAFPNYRVENEGDAWLERWDIKSIPVVLVFDQQGKLARKFDMDDPDDQFTYDQVEELVAELVGQ